MAAVSRLPARLEVYMYLHDRHYLKYLMDSQKRSSRQVAAAAGWSSHSYVLRLLKGVAKTLEPEHAHAIALYLGTDFDRLFTAKASQISGQTVAGKRAS